jgi:signal transduction histidine kinase
VRRRLLVVYLTLLTATITALAVPLAAGEASRETQTVYIDRQGDTARFASIAEPALRTGETVTLRAELATYHALYGIDAAVISRTGVLMASSPSGSPPLDRPDVQRAVTAALSGDRTDQGRVWPWQRGELVVAEPVGRGGEIVGAAVTISPTVRLRSAVLRGWGSILLIGLAALATAGFAAWPLTGWMLRPMRDLDAAAHAIAAGRLAVRAGAGGGPPELRRLTATFNAMAGTIATLLERQRRFVYYAGHQLRNPLTALRLRVEGLADFLGPDGAGEHGHALSEVDRLAGICDGLLALAQAETGHARPANPGVSAAVDAATVADDRVAAWAPVARRSGIVLRRTGAVTAAVLGPPDQLSQILDTLLDNAVKFAGAGATVTVDVTTRDTGWVDIHVVDDGPGLGAGDLARAVEPFWRATGDQNRPGSGLGLAIAATLATAGGGLLRLRPDTPRGLRAELRLPAGQGLLPR